MALERLPQKRLERVVSVAGGAAGAGAGATAALHHGRQRRRSVRLLQVLRARRGVQELLRDVPPVLVRSERSHPACLHQHPSPGTGCGQGGHRASLPARLLDG